MDIKHISLIAPPTPDCFHDRLIWVEYLHSSQAQKVGKVRPFEDGKYQPNYPFCRDCTAQHSHDMHAQGRCNFPAYEANLQPQAAPTEADKATTP